MRSEREISEHTRRGEFGRPRTAHAHTSTSAPAHADHALAAAATRSPRRWRRRRAPWHRRPSPKIASPPPPPKPAIGGVARRVGEVGVGVVHRVRARGSGDAAVRQSSTSLGWSGSASTTGSGGGSIAATSPATSKATPRTSNHSPRWRAASRRAPMRNWRMLSTAVPDVAVDAPAVVGGDAQRLLLARAARERPRHLGERAVAYSSWTWWWGSPNALLRARRTGPPRRPASHRNCGSGARRRSARSLRAARAASNATTTQQQRAVGGVQCDTRRSRGPNGLPAATLGRRRLNIVTHTDLMTHYWDWQAELRLGRRAGRRPHRAQGGVRLARRHAARRERPRSH